MSYDPDCHLGTLRTIEEREAKERAELFRGLFEENEDALWRLVKFEAEHEQDRLDYFDELDDAAKERRRQARLERRRNAPPLPESALSLEDALAKLEDVRLSGSFVWRAKCPIHGGSARPLRIIESEVQPGMPIFHCHAGCDWRAIKDALR